MADQPVAPPAAPAAPAAPQAPVDPSTLSPEQLKTIPFTKAEMEWAQNIADMTTPTGAAPTEGKSPGVDLLARLPIPKRVNIPLFIGGRRIKFNLPHPHLNISGETADIIAKSLGAAYRDVPGGGFAKGLAIGSSNIRGEMAAKRKAEYEAAKSAFEDRKKANQKAAAGYASELLKSRMKGEKTPALQGLVKVTDEEKKGLEKRGYTVPSDNVVPRSWFEPEKKEGAKGLSLSEQTNAEDALSRSWERTSKGFTDLQDAVRQAFSFKDVQENSNIKDNALVYAMSKISDSRTGVKDAEIKLWREAQGLWLQWKNSISSITGKGYLDDRTRARMYEIIRKGVDAAARYNGQRRKTFVEKAKKRGLDPELAVPDLRDQELFPPDAYDEYGLTK